jgi:O-antigen/teichoic acid export membrane protein
MSAVFVQLYNGIDIVILHSLGKTAELGLYSAAFRLNALLVTGVSLMNSAMLPVLASESLATPRRFRGVMTQYTFVASALAAILVALAIFGSNILVTLAYGNGYLQAGQYARLLLLGAAALAINGAVAQPLLATGRERAVTLQVAATAIVCGVANLLLIPKFGAIAAAWVYLSAAVFGTVCLLPAYWNLLRGGPAAVVSRLQPSPCEVEELA